MNNLVAPFDSYESFGAVDGPGIRLVYFLQGCPLRCKYCHNPETQLFTRKKSVSVNEILERYKRNKSFYKNGGITCSGGEPLCHIRFLIELFKKAKQKEIHTCVDTSMGTFNDNPIVLKSFEILLKYCDLFICDIKEMDDLQHKKLTSVSNVNILKGIKWLDEHGANFWVRHVLVPGWTDKKVDLLELGRFISSLKHLEKFEILPYHNMMIPKYKQLNLEFELGDVIPPTKDYCVKMLQFVKQGMKNANSTFSVSNVTYPEQITK